MVFDPRGNRPVVLPTVLPQLRSAKAFQDGFLYVINWKRKWLYILCEGSDMRTCFLALNRIVQM